MSSHPNVMLIAALTPDDLPMKTYRAIRDELGIGDDDDLKIGDDDYTAFEVMQEDYDEGWQLSLPPGTIYAFNLVTYGYGEKLTWESLSVKRDALDEWARGICERHHCTSQIFVSANYW